MFARALSSRLRVAAIVAVLAVVLTGCQVDLDVLIDIEEDGSGTVTAAVQIDPEARSRIPSLSEVLVTADLEAAGWTVGAAELDEEGNERVELSKEFDNPAELQVVLDELFGAESGVFVDWEYLRDGSVSSQDFTLVGTVDLSAGLELFSDDELQALLDFDPVGIDIAAVEAELGTPIEETVNVQVAVILPDSEEQVFDVPIGESVDVVASTSNENRVAQLLGWVKTALLVLFFVALALAGINYLLDRRYANSKPERRPQSVSERVPGGTAAGAAAQPAAPRSKMQMIVLDAHDVLFRLPSDPSEWLVPFIRSHGGNATDEEIIEYHRQATLGRLHAAAFWESVGVEGSPEELDTQLLAGVRLQQGAKEFLREMHRRGVPIAVISNDLAEWSYRLRDLHGMSGVAPWIVSSEIGVRKPDPAAFEALRRVTGVPYHSMLIVDAQIPSLDTAKTLGMMTAWFARQRPADGAEPGHAVVTKFADFFRRRRQPEPAGGRGRKR